MAMLDNSACTVLWVELNHFSWCLLWKRLYFTGGTGRQDPVDVKTDKVLPAYCTPPNPCPKGYTGLYNISASQ